MYKVTKGLKQNSIIGFEEGSHNLQFNTVMNIKMNGQTFIIQHYITTFSKLLFFYIHGYRLRID